MINMGIFIGWLCLGLAAITLYCTARITRLWVGRNYATDAVLAFLLVGLVFIIEATISGNIVGLALYCIAASVGCLLAARMRFGRLSEQFVRKNTRSSALLFLSVLVAGFLYWQYGSGYINSGLLAVVLVIFALLTAVLFIVQAVWSLKHYGIKSLIQQPDQSLKRYPTVTLAIPARNETHALTACLEAALQSDYEKLEIIVLDDCSQDNTSQLIRSFAHAGVRFVQGDEPASDWLGKNQACSTLLKEASGEYVLFMGVDTILEPTTISRLVAVAEQRQFNMISVLPTRVDTFMRFTVRPMHYVWQILLPLTSDRVPVSSECWLVRRAELTKLGGFAGVKNQIVPEKTFARAFTRQNGYRFIVSNKHLPVYFDKKWSSQLETSVRLWYPMCRQSPLFAIGLALGILLLGLGPFFGLFTDILFIKALSIVICVLYVAAYGMALRRLQPHLWWLHMILLPAALLQEFFSVLASMLRYEFSDVNWKGRNVCYPVLRKM